ncbi:MAG: LacI family transcriptional regulator [Ardenticatenaceae bacterium]|nr:LacI family transcriptional regulator [Ardenticatenaceae bacterium]
MPVTLRDVAQRAGYSVTTVSRALNGFSDVNEETRRHIQAVARELGYIPNLSARQLQTRRSQALGFVIPTPPERLNEPFFTEFLSAVGVEAARHGYDLLISARAPDTHELETYRRLVQGGRVDGMVLVRGRRHDPRVDLLRRLDVPFVLFGRTDDDADYAWIDVDGTAGVRLATGHLLALGHTRIAYVSGPAHYSFVLRRQQGYEEALRAARRAVEPRRIIAVEHMTEREGYQTGRMLLAQAERPTAIVAVTDLVAYGVMRAVHNAGGRVGRDVAVVGFDGLASSAYSTPPLSTVFQPIAEIGHRVVEILLTLVTARPSSWPQILISPTLVVRESSTGHPENENGEI